MPLQDNITTNENGLFTMQTPDGNEASLSYHPTNLRKLTNTMPSMELQQNYPLTTNQSTTLPTAPLTNNINTGP